MTLNKEEQTVLADFLKSCELMKKNSATYKDAYEASLDKRESSGINPYLAGGIGIVLLFGLGYVLGGGGK